MAGSVVGHHSFIWRGHRLDLLPEKALWEPEQRLLLLADLHLGKAECLQAHGVPIPSDGDIANIQTLLDLAHRLQPSQVVVLGDLIHGPLGLTAELRQKLQALPELLGCRWRLIDGNHERGSWLEGLPREPACASGPLWLSHAPDPHQDRLNICGHLHPVAVVGMGADRLRLPCFVHQRDPDLLVLPSFGQMTGGHPYDQADALWLVADGSVLPYEPPSKTDRLRSGWDTRQGQRNGRLKP
jgi:DNA ligase-associated metallophosphoesterase